MTISRATATLAVVALISVIFVAYGATDDAVQLAGDAPEVRTALQYALSELRRIEPSYSEIQVTKFEGELFFIKLDLVPFTGASASSHEIMVSQLEGGKFAGMAIDVFPETQATVDDHMEL